MSKFCHSLLLPFPDLCSSLSSCALTKICSDHLLGNSLSSFGGNIPPFRTPFSLHQLGTKSNQDPSLIGMLGWNPVTPLIFGGKVRSISSPEKKGLQKWPDSGEFPMFAKDVCRIGFPSFQWNWRYPSAIANGGITWRGWK